MANELSEAAVLQRIHNNKAAWIRPKDHSHNKQANIEINDQDPFKNTNRCMNEK
jgi:hypothetical protein